MKRLYTALLCLGLAWTGAYGRSTVYTDQVKTLQIVAGDDWLAQPVITLGSDEALHISFDELSHTYHRFVYRVEHCEADWSPSTDLFESDYLEGFNNNPIEDYQTSINTNVLYTHYSLQLPNDKCRLKMSGNYRLTVYDEDHDNKRILTAEFMVVDPKMKVSMDMTTNTDIDVNQSHQQISVAVDFGNMNVSNLDEQIQLVVTQNGREDNARRNLRPNFINTKGLQWVHNRDLIFEAGNEYHKYEILDVSHPTMGIDRISWDGHYYNAYPFVSGPRRNYLYDVDADGAFYIRNSDNTENDYTAEYVFVHYQLRTDEIDSATPVIEGRWTTDADWTHYAMEYDREEKSYFATILQKQGYYSYQYLLRSPGGQLTIPPSEGSFYQTENRYQAYLYYKGIGQRTWQLVGYQEITNGN